MRSKDLARTVPSRAPGGTVALVDSFLLALAILTFLLLVGYLLYGGLYRAFLRVGFNRGEVSLILLGTFIGGLIDLPLFRVNGWLLAINVGGAVVPIVVTILLLRRRPSLLTETLAATVLVTIATYLVTDVTDLGISSPFPLYLVPPLVAAALSLGAFWREEDYAAPLAYIAGTLGALIGADVLRLPELFAVPPAPDGPTGGSIGGAAVLDMVYLTGVLAVALDALFFQQVHRWKTKHAVTGYDEGPVFTTSTPSEVIAAYVPKVPESPRRPEPPRPPRPPTTTSKPATTKAPPLTPPASAPTPPPYAPSSARVEPPSPAEQARLAQHRAWEERMRQKKAD